MKKFSDLIESMYSAHIPTYINKKRNNERYGFAELHEYIKKESKKVKELNEDAIEYRLHYNSKWQVYTDKRGKYKLNGATIRMVVSIQFIGYYDVIYIQDVPFSYEIINKDCRKSSDYKIKKKIVKRFGITGKHLSDAFSFAISCFMLNLGQEPKDMEYMESAIENKKYNKELISELEAYIVQRVTEAEKALYETLNNGNINMIAKDALHSEHNEVHNRYGDDVLNRYTLRTHKKK